MSVPSKLTLLLGDVDFYVNLLPPTSVAKYRGDALFTTISPKKQFAAATSSAFESREQLWRYSFDSSLDRMKETMQCDFDGLDPAALGHNDIPCTSFLVDAMSVIRSDTTRTYTNSNVRARGDK
eukprot:scaffold22599_cov139-Cylindrotheca_fusiformis.AAC.13